MLLDSNPLFFSGSEESGGMAEWVGICKLSKGVAPEGGYSIGVAARYGVRLWG